MSDLDRRALRAQLRLVRRQLPAAQRITTAQAIAAHLFELPQLQQARHVAGYWAVDGEVGLHALLVGQPAFVYCLPCLRDDKRLEFAPWRSGDPLVTNRYGIPEPETTARIDPAALDVVLLPLVGFDRRGARLGSGAGYYDRTFAFLQQTPRPVHPLLVGVAHALQEVDALPVEPWDVPLDYIVTERGLMRSERETSGEE
jgi:5-formyltetrahydrofolate cyclo-ligase